MPFGLKRGRNAGNSTNATALHQQLEEQRKWRRHRFRILVGIDGSDESYDGLRFAAKMGWSDDCDIILLYVRSFDHGLRTGGLQVRIARENMLDWGLELPEIQYLKKGRDILVEHGDMSTDWDVTSSHTDLMGDPLGDNKIEYRHENGKSIVLKLKTAPDPASGILDQYEMGPYNLIILGQPGHWSNEISSFWDTGAARKVAIRAPCSVLISRAQPDYGKGHLLCIDGTEHCLDSMRRAAILARHCNRTVSLLAVAPNEKGLPRAEESLAEARHMLDEIDIEAVDSLTRVGDPTEEICKLGPKFSLIVVSDSGTPLLKRLVTGSVAFNVMGMLKTSVLNVR